MAEIIQSDEVFEGGRKVSAREFLDDGSVSDVTFAPDGSILTSEPVEGASPTLPPVDPLEAVTEALRATGEALANAATLEEARQAGRDLLDNI